MTSLTALLPRLAPHREFDLQVPLDTLAQAGITTDVDLLFATHVSPRPGLSYEQLQVIHELVAGNLAAVSSSGVELAQQSRNRKGKQPARFSTSLEPLDDLLDGGLDQGEIVELTGPKHAGRTALALYTLLLHLLLHPAARGAWFDSMGTFDPHRCLAILRDVLVPRLLNLGGTFADEGEAEPSPEQLAIAVLDRLVVSRVQKASEVLDVLAEEVSSRSTGQDLRMVVVDSLDNLLGGEALSAGKAQAHAALTAFMRRLTSIARSPEAALAILIITTVPSSDTPTRQDRSAGKSAVAISSTLPHQPPLRYALDHTLAHLVDVSLLMMPAAPLFGPEDSRDRGFVEVLKNSRGQEGGLVPFELLHGHDLSALML